MGVESVSRYTAPIVAPQVQSPQPPTPKSANPLADRAEREMQPQPQPLSDHRQLVDGMLQRVPDMDVRAALDKATLKSALSAEGGGRKVGFFESRGLEKLRQTAERTLATLDEFDGREFADAVTKIQPGDPAESKAVVALKAAIQAQFELAAGLRESAANAGGDRQLNTLAHQAELRGFELGRLADELHQLATREKSGGLDAAGAARLDGKGLAASAHQPAVTSNATQLGMDALRGQLDGVITQLEGVLNQPKIAVKEYFTAKSDLMSIRSAIADARANGVFLGKDRGRLQVDDRVLASLESQVSGMEHRLANHGSHIARNVAASYADNFIFPDPAALRRAIPATAPKEVLEGIAELEVQRGRVKDFINGSLTMPQLKEKLPKRQWLLEYADRLVALAESDPAMAENAAVKGTIAQLRSLGDYQPPSDDELKEVVNPDSGKLRTKSNSYHHAFEHLQQILDRAREVRSEKIGVTGADLRSVIHGDFGFSQIAEARMHGFDVGDIDPAVYLAKQPPVVLKESQGGVNSVTVLAYNDAQGVELGRRVFKAERSARFGINTSNPGAAYADIESDFQTLSVNMAAHEVADLLGCGDRIPRTYLSVHKGEIGLSMEMAPGSTPRDAITDYLKEGKIAPTLQQLAGLDAEAQRSAKGQIAQQLNQLQWMDLISGQMDRHDGNWMLDIARQGGAVSVKVSGIDNDLAFADKAVGIGKFVLTDTEIEVVAKKWAALAGVKGSLQAKIDAFCKLPGVTMRKAGEHVVDLGKMDVVSRAATLLEEAGATGRWMVKTVFAPDAIDYQMYMGIVRLTQDANCTEFRAALAKRHLSEAKIEAAVARLKDAAEHAEKLRAEGRVFQDRDWGDPRLIEELSHPDLSDFDELVEFTEKAHTTTDFFSTERTGLPLNYAGYFAREDGGIQSLFQTAEEIARKAAQ